jgi:rfaE bifunctional protein kinase chain/domain
MNKLKNETDKMLTEQKENIIKEFAEKKILVIGDLMLDEYIFGNVNRVSPEAPVPVIHKKNTKILAGGAANVVKNIRALGASCFVAGMVGKDEDGETLLNIFNNDLKIPREDLKIIEDPDYTTIKKTRIVGNRQQICRIDNEEIKSLKKRHAYDVIDFIMYNFHKSDAIIISDYGKGFLTEDLLLHLTAIITKHKKIVCVDPHNGHFHWYHNATILTPNSKQVEIETNINISNTDNLNEAAIKVLNKRDIENLLITRGSKGMSLFQRNGQVNHFPPTNVSQVFDVTGAGDTVISIFTLGLAHGLDLKTCCVLSNKAGGLAVQKIGTVGIEAEELFKK